MTATLKMLQEALKAGDKDKVVALYADDATIEDPVGSPLKAGKAAIDTFYANAVARKIWIELLTFEELPDRQTNVEAAVHVGERVVQSRETYTFKPDGKIATMKAMPAAK
jgi:steroid delta-isomerase